jgi:hypothetical protein
MTDILKDVDIHLDCSQCEASFDISAAVVAQSQELLEHGCPGSSYECPATVFSQLVDPGALRALVDAWRQVEQSAQGRADGVVLRVHPTLKAGEAPEGKPSAIDRWENEGGALVSKF